MLDTQKHEKGEPMLKQILNQIDLFYVETTHIISSLFYPYIFVASLYDIS